MRITNLRQGMKLYYVIQETNGMYFVKECIYNYTNKNGKKNVSFKSKRGTAEIFLKKGTVFYDCEEDAYEEINRRYDEREENKKRMKITMEEYRKETEKEKIILSKKIIDKICASENINSLPSLEELYDIDREEQEFIYETLSDSDIFNQNLKMTIKDGTEIIYEHYAKTCCNDDSHWDLYYIPREEIYICMECGEVQQDNEEDELDFDKIIF